jgi:hypothetical protein
METLRSMLRNHFDSPGCGTVTIWMEIGLSSALPFFHQQSYLVCGSEAQDLMTDACLSILTGLRQHSSQTYWVLGHILPSQGKGKNQGILEMNSTALGGSASRKTSCSPGTRGWLAGRLNTALKRGRKSSRGLRPRLQVAGYQICFGHADKRGVVRAEEKKLLGCVKRGRSLQPGQATREVLGATQANRRLWRPHAIQA